MDEGNPRGDIADEAMRRAMGPWGFEPTDPQHRAAFENTSIGARIRLNAYADSIFRQLTLPLEKLIERLTRALDSRHEQHPHQR